MEALPEVDDGVTALHPGMTVPSEVKATGPVGANNRLPLTEAV